MPRKKFFIVTTIPDSLNFFSGQLRLLGETFEVCAIASMPDLLEQYGEKEGVRTHCIPMKRSISLFRDVWCLCCFIVFFLRERPPLGLHAGLSGSICAMDCDIRGQRVDCVDY